MHPVKPVSSEELRHFFSGLTEYAFQTRLGVADPPLVEYLGQLLARFFRTDTIFAVRNPSGRRLDAVADMLVEADARVGEAKRQVHRHIGDFTLFWSGVYPEALSHLQRGPQKDFFLDYCEHGKRAYYIASTLPARDNDAKKENALLERLSHDFELCVYGLGEVRRQWERRDENGEAPRGPIML
ncbi:MAG TPA: hypothetical protein VHX65_01030 [Pirellulales bacterium]|nr:hypothetical protein [Pirellulales bacterium]